MGFADRLRNAGRAALGALAKADDDDETAAPGQGANGPSSGLATAKAPSIQEASEDPKSLFWDPFAIIDALGYKDRPSAISYHTLNAVVWRTPIIQAMIKTRITQVSAFSVPQEDKFGTGFRVRLRDRKARLTTAAEKRAREIEQWLMSTGSTNNPVARDDFETFLRKITRDSMTYDQYCFEVVPSRSGKPAEFYAVDGSTFRLADTTKLRYDDKNREEIRYVQIYDGLVTAEYTANDLCFGIRNPTTDIRNQGYGQSEIEMLINTITALLWSWDYNQKFFSQGTSTKGILNFKGTIPERQLRAFRRHWYSMVAGIENAFKTPITNAGEGLEWINMQLTNKDMEFGQWFDFLIKVSAAIFEMDPLEINFKYGDAGGQKSMFESGNKSKLTASKDKGLKPLLRHIANKMSLHLVQPLDEDFVFEFLGLDAMSADELADLNAKQVATYKTIDEVRAEEDLPPLPDGEGTIILSPVFMQARTMGAQQEAGVGDFAEEPDDGGFPGDLDGLPDSQDDDDEAGEDAEKSFQKSVGARVTSPASPSIIIDLDI